MQKHMPAYMLSGITMPGYSRAIRPAGQAAATPGATTVQTTNADGTTATTTVTPQSAASDMPSMGSMLLSLALSVAIIGGASYVGAYYGAKRSRAGRGLIRG